MLTRIYASDSLTKDQKALKDFISTLKKPVFLVHTHDYSREIAMFVSRMAKDTADKHSLFICVNSKVPYCYQDLKLDFRAIDDYFSVSDYESIDDFVYDFTKKWYLPQPGEGYGITEFSRIHLGRVVEYDFQLFLIRRLKWFWGMHKIISQSKPDGVVIIEDTGEFDECAKLSEEIFGIPLFLLHVKDTAKDTFSSKKNMKSFFAEIASWLLDSCMRLGLKFNRRAKVLIDSRVYADLAPASSMPDFFMLAPFEKGLKLRLNFLKKRSFYLPFYFPSDFGVFKIRHKNLWQYANKKLIFQGIDVKGLVENRIGCYFSDYFPLIARNIKLLNALLEKKTIRAIVLRHDVWELQRVCVEVAKKFSVPTIVVQHGVFGEKGEKEIFADKIAVWGDLCATIYESFGNKKDKCRVTGNPRIDRFFSRQPEFSRERVCALLNLDENKKIILLASGVYRSFLSSYLTGDENQPIISELIKIMKDMPQYQLIIKLHPYETEEFSRSIIAYYGVSNVVITRNFDLHSLINASDLFVTKRSSVGLKAMVLSKPVIIVNFEKRKEITPYASSGAAIEVNDQVSLRKAIVSALEDTRLRETLSLKSREFGLEYAYKFDGGSSKRVVDFIKEAVSS